MSARRPTARDTTRPKATKTYRLPADLARHLATEAERQNVSENTLVVGLLAGATSWRPARA